MVRYIALALLLCAVATATMGCPRRVPIGKAIDTPAASVTK